MHAHKFSLGNLETNFYFTRSHLKQLIPPLPPQTIRVMNYVLN